jgi:beta-galactosidase GanA
MVNGTGQLIVNSQPFLILGGELGNSSAGTAAQADQIVPKLAAMRVNTILTPVAWEQIEANEGTFDFSILDHWIETSRRHNMHLVLLWFGSWKNAFSNYSPGWVKSNPKRFPRAESSDGKPLEILSTLSAEESTERRSRICGLDASCARERFRSADRGDGAGRE